MRLLSQSNEQFLAPRNSSARILAFAKVPSALILQRRTPGATYKWVMLQKRNLKYSELNYFTMGNKLGFRSGFCMNSSSVRLLSRVRLFGTPRTATCQASLSITNSWAYSNSCPSRWRCHPTISSSVVPSSSRLQSFPASGCLFK